MRILLRNTETGLFYAGPDEWTEDASAACDFRRPDLALDRVCEANLEAMELVMHFDHSPFAMPAAIVNAGSDN